MSWPEADKVFLALAIWREARGESYDARVAVGCSVRNRVQRPKWWGKTYLEVIFKKWQYSSLTDPKDRQLTTWPVFPDKSFDTALKIADDVIHDRVAHPMPGADSYYDSSIDPPKWATPEKFVGKIGKLSFYNMDEDFEDTIVHLPDVSSSTAADS